MSQVFELLIKRGTVVTPGGSAVADIAVDGGRIVGIGEYLPTSAGKVYDAAGLHVLPGVIDSQVHFREPGLEWKEDLETGSRAAALGGVVAVFEMPNTNPNTVDQPTIEHKLARARDRMWTDHAFYVGGRPADR